MSLDSNDSSDSSDSDDDSDDESDKEQKKKQKVSTDDSKMVRSVRSIGSRHFQGLTFGASRTHTHPPPAFHATNQGSAEHPPFSVPGSVGAFQKPFKIHNLFPRFFLFPFFGEI